MRRKRPNAFASTEEYNRQVKQIEEQAWKRRSPSEIRRRFMKTAGNTDYRIVALYRERDALNSLPENQDDPWEIDHIRPIAQGGEHRYENLRLLRKSKNHVGEFRSEERIALLLQIVADMQR